MKDAYPYQREAVDSVYSYWEKPRSGNGLLVCPTGSGKSLIIAILCKEIQEKWPGTRILILSHDKRLVKQDFDEFIEAWAEAPAGIYCAGLGRKDMHAPILFASIQSIEKNTTKLNPCPEIVFIDEAHLIPRKESTRYMKCLSLLKIMYPHLRCIGLTATPYRLDSGWLHKGEDAIFDDIIYEIEVQYLIDNGYLCPVVPQGGGDIKIDTTGLHHSNGEFIPGELEKRAMEGDITLRAVEDFVKRGADRKKWLVFTTGKKHAMQVRDAIIEKGISCEMVVSDNGEALNDRYINEYKSGQIKCLVNVVMLNTGFNVRQIDLLVDLAPTESPGRYVQKTGRGMRTFPGKKDCLLLDFAGNAQKHGPIDAVQPKTPGEGGGVAPAKECPGIFSDGSYCGAIIQASLKVCPVCGHVFPAQETKIHEKPVKAPVLKSQIEPVEYTVTGCRYARHKKEGKKDSVRIEYSCGFLTFKEWVFPEASSPQQQFYYGKFMAAVGLEYNDWPRTVDAFLATPPRSPSRIWVTQEGKFDRVCRKEYGDGAPLPTVEGTSLREQRFVRRYDIKEYDDVVPF